MAEGNISRQEVLALVDKGRELGIDESTMLIKYADWLAQCIR